MAIEIPGFPAPVEGLDIAAGLRRLDGDTALYIALLRDFISTEQDAAKVIAAALAQGDRNAAIRRAHAIRRGRRLQGAARFWRTRAARAAEI